MDQLKQLPATEHFPEAGLKKLDHLHVTLQPLNMQLHALQARKSQLEGEVAEIHINDAFILHKSEIEYIREQMSLYEEKGKNKQVVEKKLISFNMNMRY